MVVYQSFHTIGLNVEVLPLLDTSPLDNADENLFEKEAEICADDPINHVAIDYDNWQCPTCHEGYPTVEEWKRFNEDQYGKTSLVGTDSIPSSLESRGPPRTDSTYKEELMIENGNDQNSKV
jgi:hypothetical protein